MFAITRKPRLLIKLSAPPPKDLDFLFSGCKLSVSFDALFTSIGDSNSTKHSPLSTWYIMRCRNRGAEVNAWDLCHHIVKKGFGVAGIGLAEFAEPDLEQRWITGTPEEHALRVTRDCDEAELQNSTPPLVSHPDNNWFLDSEHSELGAARAEIGEPLNRVRIAHLDTGYDRDHKTVPRYLRYDLQKNFIEGEVQDDARDRTFGVFTNLGHGSGALSLLAGNSPHGIALGGAAFLDLIPLRAADSIMQFKNSEIARALDYVHKLCQDPSTRVHVVSISMGGLCSQVWAEAINALYDTGAVVIAAAGNNYGNLPTHNIVYPARFGRVIAACGVMANDQPYADLPLAVMGGNYGPPSKMSTAMAAYTPNIPWARIGCGTLVDYDGRGTSAAASQIAAAAALWIQKYKSAWEQYPENWMCVEAVRTALFQSSRVPLAGEVKYLGRGKLKAMHALNEKPVAPSSLRQQPVDTASFPFLRAITGSVSIEEANISHRMLELEALQISQQSKHIDELLTELEDAKVETGARLRMIKLLHKTPGISNALSSFLAKCAPSGSAETYEPETLLSHASPRDATRLKLAMAPPINSPHSRRLRVFAHDPLVSNNPDLSNINLTTLEIAWEKTLPGPVGEYLEVVDVDPATGCSYAPVDLNHPTILSTAGLSPSESDPRFHQQMVYAVAMKTIYHFERALGRVALWAPRFVSREDQAEPERHFVRRLRIYPHALREANSYYSPKKKALLFGYFSASSTNAGENLPGGTIFCCLSHDIIAHETTHALLDGLHRYFGEPSNEDVFAFHEAFADIVALFQHFTVPEALTDQIAKTRGDLAQQNLLGELALQFGHGIGARGALRSAIGQKVNGRWVPFMPTTSDYQKATEPHEKGAILVAAVFDAFLDIYRRRSQDLIRLATCGAGVLPEGAIAPDLVNRLAREACKTAGHILNMCIRALDYCPPVDINFGDYLRALITADRDLVQNDEWNYRSAVIQGFRRRGIYPHNVRNLSSGSLCWEKPELPLEMEGRLADVLKSLVLDWDLRKNRLNADQISENNGKKVWKWLNSKDCVKDADLHALGIYRNQDQLPKHDYSKPGVLNSFEVHSVRPARRIGPNGQERTDLIVEITQSWLSLGGAKYRGGCTLIIDLEQNAIRYVVRKRVGNPDSLARQNDYHRQLANANLACNYLGASALVREPFAMIHRTF